MLEGSAHVRLSNKEYVVKEGQSLLMSATFVHAVSKRKIAGIKIVEEDMDIFFK